MILWRFSGTAGLLKWTPKSFPSFDCRSGMHDVCAGAVISLEGTLIAPEHGLEELETTCLGEQRQEGSIGASSEGALFPVRRDGKSGAIDRSGRVVIPLCFDFVGEFHEGLARFARGKLFGFVDKRGRIVIPPRFTSEWNFSEGLARVTSDDDPYWHRCGYVDQSGMMAIKDDIECESAFAAGYDFRNGLAKMDEKITKHGFLDKTGQVAIRPEFESVETFSAGLAAAKKIGEEKWGYIDVNGDWAIEPQFAWAFSFSDGVALVHVGDNFGYIDKSGAMVLRLPQSNLRMAPCGEFHEGLASFAESGKYGFVDHAGRVVLPATFDRVQPFADGLAAVMVGEEWGYADKSGRMAIPLKPLKQASDFRDGLAKVLTVDGKEGYIDKDNKFVWGPVQREKGGL